MRSNSLPTHVGPFWIAAFLMLAACDSGAASGPQIKGPFTTRPTETTIPSAPEAITADTEQFFVTYGIPKSVKGDKLEGTLIAVDVGNAAPPNSEAITAEVVVPDDGAHWGNFTFKKPTAGWPRGSYRVDVKRAGTQIGSVAFQIK